MNCRIKLNDEIETAKQYESLKQMLLRLLDDPQISGEDRDFPAPFRFSSIDWHKRPSALVPLIMAQQISATLLKNTNLITEPGEHQIAWPVVPRSVSYFSGPTRLIHGVQLVPERHCIRTAHPRYAKDYFSTI
jgi:hypothetical protein